MSIESVRKMTTGDSTANKEFKKEIIETHSAQETFALGQRIGLEALPGQVYTLIGDLGVGKTVFTQGVADGLGITEPVNSPTFTIVQIYEEGRMPFYHFDVYRIGDVEEMEEIGYEDCFYGEGVCLIEWADLIQEILPPDVNCGMYGFSVDNGAIRYGLSAIKSVGRPVIESLVKERDENGQYRSLKDFMERNSPQMNKRAVENFIKAGALDCLDGNRRQKMLVYQKISDSISQDKKNSLAGQMSLFDLVSEEDKKEFEIRMPDVEEFGKEELLGYEKEVLGIYLSGHPLENYRGMMEKTISAKTSDFQQDEETNLPKVTDGQKVIIGGMITDKTIKYTKNNKVMAFLTVEDLVGTVEVVVFPRDYEKSQQFLNEEGRVFIQGRVSAEDDRARRAHEGI